MIAHVMTHHMPKLREPKSDLGTYAEQMRDAGRGHLLRPEER